MAVRLLVRAESVAWRVIAGVEVGEDFVFGGEGYYIAGDSGRFLPGDWGVGFGYEADVGHDAGTSLCEGCMI